MSKSVLRHGKQNQHCYSFDRYLRDLETEGKTILQIPLDVYRRIPHHIVVSIIVSY